MSKKNSLSQVTIRGGVAYTSPQDPPTTPPLAPPEQPAQEDAQEKKETPHLEQ